MQHGGDPGKKHNAALTLRAALRQAGATGYRQHREDIPGQPDVAFNAPECRGIRRWGRHPDHWDPDKVAY